MNWQDVKTWLMKTHDRTPEELQSRAEALVVPDLALEHRDLDAIIPGALECCDLRHVRIRHMRGPEEQVEADFHGGVLPGIVLARRI